MVQQTATERREAEGDETPELALPPVQGGLSPGAPDAEQLRHATGEREEGGFAAALLGRLALIPPSLLGVGRRPWVVRATLLALALAGMYVGRRYFGVAWGPVARRVATDAAVYVPIGVLGFVRWGMWLAKRIPAMFYRPIKNDYDTTATIITPVYNEEPVLFRRAIESWIANGPDRIIAVIDVTDTTCMRIAGEYPQIEVVPIDIPGKRAALAAGVDISTTEIVALVDSDVIWEPGVLAKLKMPFADPAIGGVGSRQNMYPTDGVRATIWERMADIYLDIRYSDEVPATTIMGKAVSCLSGRTAAYRTELLKSVREPFLNEQFNGRPCMSGDDKRYTCLVLQRGYRTWNQLDARVYSTFKPDFKGFRKQRIRWSRNSFRSDLRALWQGWVWRYPYLAVMLVDKTVAPFTLLVGPVVLAVAAAIGDWHLVGALLAWWHVSRAFKLVPHFRRRPADIALLPLFVLTTYYMSLVKAYALFTINEHKWLTRAVAMVDGQATRVSEAEQEGAAA